MSVKRKSFVCWRQKRKETHMWNFYCRKYYQKRKMWSCNTHSETQNENRKGHLVVPQINAINISLSSEMMGMILHINLDKCITIVGHHGHHCLAYKATVLFYIVFRTESFANWRLTIKPVYISKIIVFYICTLNYYFRFHLQESLGKFGPHVIQLLK